MTVRNTGYSGSNCIKVFEYNAAGTGLTAAQCEREGISYDIAYVIPQDKVSLMPDTCPLHYKLIYEVPTGKVLGAQAISKGDAAKRADIVAALIKFGGTVDDLRDLAESGAYIIDVRPEIMYQQGHIKTAVNIPIGQLRQRRDEIPKDRPVYVHCKIDQTSYNAVMALQGNGFKNVYNISGGFRGICYYEYFNDRTQNRESIVSNYNFE